MNTDYVPSLTHASGQVLTVADWTASGVHTASCDLAVLLVKPGITTLMQLNNLKQYWHWPGKLLLNLTSLPQNKHGQCQIRSPLDGRMLTFSKEEILNLVEHLNPDYINLPSYLYPLASEQLQNQTHQLHENNQPAEDALNGLIYTRKNTFSICSDHHTKDFALLDDTCTCPACNAGFTRAYFYHLYQHTPLLCHRWLIMHNLSIIHSQ